jgi:hypothetical protein
MPLPGHKGDDAPQALALLVLNILPDHLSGDGRGISLILRKINRTICFGGAVFLPATDRPYHCDYEDRG